MGIGEDYKLKYYLKKKREWLGRAHLQLKEHLVLKEEKVHNVSGMIEVEKPFRHLEPTPLFYR